MTAIEPYEHQSSYAIVPVASELAQQIARTDFVPQALRGKPEAVMAAMLQGHELGIGPMASLGEISVINGKPCLSAKLMRALVQRAGHEIWFEQKTNTRVTICGRRQGWPEDRIAKVTWTMDDARQAGIAGGQNYRKYPRQMLAARATGEICRDNFADVLGGIGYTPEELTDGDLVADGDLAIDSATEVVAEQPTTKRRATKAVAKKAAARKAAPAKKAPPAPEPALPPLPGEDGFDDGLPAEPEHYITADEDVLDAVELAGAERCDAIQAAIDDLTQEERQDLGEWWKSLGFPALRSGDLTADQAAAIEQAIATYGTGGATDGRNRKMWALVAEAWPEDSGEERDRRRKALIGVVADGRTTSSKDLTEGEWDDLYTALEAIGAGSMELHLRASGDYELRPKRGES